MLIGIDCRLWSQTGVGRYIRNLVFNLGQVDKKNKYVLFTRVQDNVGSVVKFPNFKIVEIEIPWHSLSEQIKFPKILNSYNLDLMHFTYFSMPIMYKGAYVLTIHDLILHHFSTGRASTKSFPAFAAKRFFYKKVIEKSAKNAKAIIAVSASTKEEIVDHLKIGEEKVTVIYEGVDLVSSAKKDNLNFLYLLYVGNTYPHKNPGILIKAFEVLAKINSNFKLIMVSRNDYFFKKLTKDLDKKTLDKIILMENVDDAKLSNLYVNATALIIPSLMEGFGLPILEAFASKCVVIASDIAVFREIGKDALIYFDPKDTNDLVKKIEKIVAITADEKEKIVSLGQDRLKLFSWKKMAQQTLQVYKS